MYSCCSFSLLKAIAISFSLLFAIVFKIKKNTTITIAIVGRMITIRRAIEKRHHEPIYKPDTKKLRKEVKSEKFAIAKLEER